MITSEYTNVASILTWTTLIHSLVACLATYIIIVIILRSLFCNHVKRTDIVVVILSAKIYLFVSISSTILLAFNIQTILGDLRAQSFHSSSCIFAGYFCLIMFFMMYMSFVNQAFYRLIRVVYHQYHYLLSLKFYMILSLVELVFSCVLLCPLLVWKGVVYLENEYYCYPSFTDIRSILWTGSANTMMPFYFLTIIYARLVIYLRKQRFNHNLATRRRQMRDTRVIQRILIIVILLLTLVTPGFVFILLFIITGKEYPLTIRIAFLFPGISMAGLSIGLLVAIPQLKSIIQKLYLRSNIVSPLGEKGCQ